jgi:hypothetical protein
LDFRDIGLCEAEHKTKHQRGEATSKGVLLFFAPAFVG